jgi:ATP-dependent RNA helicase DDX18/HAS1
LHQSARDGYRSYLQAYASYSLKKIFDVNALDLAKVGKAFGFAVPPRVNVGMGGRNGGANKSGKKRRRDDVEAGSDDDEEPLRGQRRSKEKKRRIEILGRKKVDKEVYRKNNNRQEMAGWSR